jgi:pilus assembly protein Flp/PilA
MSTWRHLLADKRGANMVEYILLVGVVALLSVTAFKYFSGKVWDKTTKQGEEVTHIGNLGCAGPEVRARGDPR